MMTMMAAGVLIYLVFIFQKNQKNEVIADRKIQTDG